jgi:Protein of unknown function (DUF2877)
MWGRYPSAYRLGVFSSWSPVAASTVLAPLLDGPPRELTVVGSGRYAAYLTGTGGEVVAVVAQDAIVPSCSVVLPAGRRPHDVLHAGEPVRAGAGGLLSPTHRFPVSRWWPPATVTAPRPARPFWANGARELLRPLLVAAPNADPSVRQVRSVAAPAAAAVLASEVEKAAALLVGVLGLGPGLTPSGDDVTAGLLLVLRGASRHQLPSLTTDVDRLSRLVLAEARARTTAVSAALLGEAAQGRAAVEVAEAARQLLGHAGPEKAAPVFAALLGIGHTSGVDLATGMLAAADALSATDDLAYRRSA